MVNKKYMLLGLIAAMANPMDAMQKLSWKQIAGVTAGITAGASACYGLYLYLNPDLSQFVAQVPQINVVPVDTTETFEIAFALNEIPGDCLEEDLRLDFETINQVVDNYVNHNILPREDACVLKECTCNTCEEYNDHWFQCFLVEYKELGNVFCKYWGLNHKWIGQFMKTILDADFETYDSLEKIAIASLDVRKRYTIIGRFFYWQFVMDHAKKIQDIDVYKTSIKSLKCKDFIGFIKGMVELGYIRNVSDDILANLKDFKDLYTDNLRNYILDFSMWCFILKDINRFGRVDIKDLKPVFCDYWLNTWFLHQHTSDTEIITYNNYALNKGKEQITPEFIKKHTKDSIDFCEGYRLNNKTGFKHIFTCAELFNHKPVLEYLEQYSSQKKRGFKKTMHYDAVKNNNYTDAIILCSPE